MLLPVLVDWVGDHYDGVFQYRTEERTVDGLWARWIRLDLGDQEPERRLGE